jgi:patatin-like phospholipase/acyl hydrolase
MVKKILAIDGGGMYGVVPLEVCLAIETKIGKKLKNIFDLFVGTSTGALICGAALRGLKGKEPFGMSAQETINEYLDKADEIFGKNARSRFNISIPILNVNKYPKYNPQGLVTVVNNVFGSGNFAQMEEAQKLIIAAYDVTKKKPHFFRSWGEDNKTFIRDAVLASSSVPQTHPLYKIGNSYYTDGGVFASNPAMYAYSEAKTKWGDEELILVSLGTGIIKVNTDSTKPDDDLSWWIGNIFKIFLDGQEESTHEALTQIASKQANKLQYFRFNVNLETKKVGDETNLQVLNDVRKLMRDELTRRSAEFERMIGTVK